MPLWLSALCVLVVLLALAWCLFPIAVVMTLPGVPWEHRTKAARSFISASLRGMLVVPVSATAPVVILFALLFTRWRNDRLPRIFRWWDNDVSINGDAGVTWSEDPVTGIGRPDRVPEEDTPDVRAICYWAPGRHPRSFRARYVWLGLRNRGSFLAAHLGANLDYSQPVNGWGNAAVGRSLEGWALLENAGHYQLLRSKRVGKLVNRMNYGFKLNHRAMGRPRVPVTTVSFSLLRWKGQDAATAASA